MERKQGETERTETLFDWTWQWQEAGRRQGGAELLLRQAERKFGPLDRPERLRIEMAPHDRLLDWGERLVTAKSLAEIFQR